VPGGVPAGCLSYCAAGLRARGRMVDGLAFSPTDITIKHIDAVFGQQVRAGDSEQG
jgi:hypothetical protein